MMVRTFFQAMAFAGLCASSVGAQSGAGVPVEAEVLSGWTLPDGRRMAGLRLNLAPGWKTYWRVPGEAGVPPRFDWRGARNVGSVSVTWPTPQIFYEYGMRSYGFKESFVLPLVIAPADGTADMHLKGTMHLGMCADVCVPYTLQIDTPLAPPAAKPTPAIVAALAARPYSADEGEVRAATCSVTPTTDGMQVEARITLPHTGGNEVTVIEPGLPDIWTGEARTTREGDRLVAVSEMMHLDGDRFSVDRSRIRITVIGSSHAVDIQGCKGS